MRRIAIAVMGTISTLVMLFAFDASHRTGGATTALGAGGAGSGSGGTGVTGTTDGNGTLGTGSTDGSTDSGSTDGASTPAATPKAGTPTKKATTGSSSSKTYTGDTVMTRWGPVQVQIVVKGGKIVRSQAIVYPNGNDHDIGINNYALPILDQATVQMQNSQFDNISGATVTTDGYRQSLQSALDQAHL